MVALIAALLARARNIEYIAFSKQSTSCKLTAAYENKKR